MPNDSNLPTEAQQRAASSEHDNNQRPIELSSINTFDPQDHGAQAPQHRKTASRSGTLNSNYVPNYEEYARRLNVYAQHINHNSRPTIYSGRHYEALSAFLNSNATYPDPTDSIFATVHPLSNFSGQSPGQVLRYKLVKDFEHYWSSRAGNHVVFLGGHPSCEWLSRLGSRLNLDYEFLYQHFINQDHLNAGDSYCLPPLSLLSSDSIQLTFTTIGSWTPRPNISLKKARDIASTSMSSYTDDVAGGQRPHLGHSVVRDFHMHDLEHFSLTQRVTIRIVRRRDQTWTILMWTDWGNSLADTHNGPWKVLQEKHSTKYRYLPIVVDLPNASIRTVLEKREAHPDNRANIRISPSREAHLQSMTALSEEYGHIIDKEVASREPFYAISLMYKLFAASEHQFINLMEEKATSLSRFTREHASNISELQTIKTLVDQHTVGLRDALRCITKRGGSAWKSASENGKPDDVAEDAQMRLLDTFELLTERSCRTSDLCRDGISALGNELLRRDAARSIQQAEAIAKVTFIATFYVPLSFTTSFFGMNFEEINNTRGIWLWFAVSFPILAVSMLIWLLNGTRLTLVWEWVVKSWQRARQASPLIGPGSGLYTPRTLSEYRA